MEQVSTIDVENIVWSHSLYTAIIWIMYTEIIWVMSIGWSLYFMIGIFVGCVLFTNISIVLAMLTKHPLPSWKDDDGNQAECSQMSNSNVILYILLDCSMQREGLKQLNLMEWVINNNQILSGMGEYGNSEAWHTLIKEVYTTEL